MSLLQRVSNTRELELIMVYNRYPSPFVSVFVAVIIFSLAGNLAAYDILDPNGNITIKWDVMSWTPDGYVVSKICKNTGQN